MSDLKPAPEEQPAPVSAAEPAGTAPKKGVSPVVWIGLGAVATAAFVLAWAWFVPPEMPRDGVVLPTAGEDLGEDPPPPREAPVGDLDDADPSADETGQADDGEDVDGADDAIETDAGGVDSEENSFD